MRFSLLTVATLGALTTARFISPYPSATSISQEGDANGWSPKPTNINVPFFHGSSNDLRRRQDGYETCGYLNAQSQSSFYCNTINPICGWNVGLGAFGCCSYNTAQTLICPDLITTCFPYGYIGSDAPTSITLGQTSCISSDSAYCAAIVTTVSSSGFTNRVTLLYCTDQPGTATLYPTYIGEFGTTTTPTTTTPTTTTPTTTTPTTTTPTTTTPTTTTPTTTTPTTTTPTTTTPTTTIPTTTTPTTTTPTTTIPTTTTPTTTNPTITNPTTTTPTTTTPATTTTTPLTSSSTSSPIPTNSSVPVAPSGLSTGAKAGIGAGVGFAALIAIVILLWFLIFKRRRNRDGSAAATAGVQGGQPGPHSGQPQMAQQQQQNMYTPPPIYPHPVPAAAAYGQTGYGGDGPKELDSTRSGYMSGPIPDHLDYNYGQKPAAQSEISPIGHEGAAELQSRQQPAELHAPDKHTPVELHGSTTRSSELA